jgi:hypothetical protein
LSVRFLPLVADARLPALDLLEPDSFSRGTAAVLACHVVGTFGGRRPAGNEEEPKTGCGGLAKMHSVGARVMFQSSFTRARSAREPEQQTPKHRRRKKTGRGGKRRLRTANRGGVRRFRVRWPRYSNKICVCAWPVLPSGVFSSAHWLTFDVFSTPGPVNGTKGPNTGLDKPAGRASRNWQFSREPQSRNCFWAARVDPWCSQLGCGAKCSYSRTKIRTL